MSARHWRTADRGTVTAFVATLLLALIVLTGLVLDSGLALATKIRADGQAEAAARAGAQALDLTAYRATGAITLVPDQAVHNAQAHLAAQGAMGTVAVAGDSVTVTITASQPTQLLGLIGITSLTVHGDGSARPQQD
ncbi:pilus assembly protein TadG-related protein [Actinophytocola oryzae]|uniref:Putative Flp pilus-assembly TadE/G-like protein n=1 Tax=Actinophytocola oryzae TaxID=502181 RepID=A0A4R7V434_9PSEU|nr:hypothetical protein [Actinophytocola oryzae]TDV44163.1 putative Flp pilus-assembly TadE/G-like protein [Actinophytocola oryzae]